MPTPAGSLSRYPYSDATPMAGIAAQLATGSSTGQIPWVMTSSSVHGLGAAIALWFTFVPPVFYRRYIQERASRSAVA